VKFAKRIIKSRRIYTPTLLIMAASSCSSSGLPLEQKGKWASWDGFTSDHTRFLVMLPRYLLAYWLLEPHDIESVMVTMNLHDPEVTCPYCTGLHEELFRLCRNKPTAKINPKQMFKCAVNVVVAVNRLKMIGIDATDPLVSYAQSFCETRGRGREIEEKELAKLSDAVGPSRSSSVASLCWALLWGQTTGNTVNSARDKILSFSISSLTSVEAVTLVWYGPLFATIGVLNAILKRIPGTLPPLISASLGVILWFPQAMFITPIGLLSIIRHGGRVV